MNINELKTFLRKWKWTYMSHGTVPMDAREELWQLASDITPKQFKKLSSEEQEALLELMPYDYWKNEFKRY